MQNSIMKSNGKIRGERLMVKSFKDADLMHKFLNSQNDNSWRVNDQAGIFASLPHKSGHYAYAGGAWHNIKGLDLTILAHL